MLTILEAITTRNRTYRFEIISFILISLNFLNLPISLLSSSLPIFPHLPLSLLCSYLHFSNYYPFSLSSISLYISFYLFYPFLFSLYLLLSLLLFFLFISLLFSSPFVSPTIFSTVLLGCRFFYDCRGAGRAVTIRDLMSPSTFERVRTIKSSHMCPGQKFFEYLFIISFYHSFNLLILLSFTSPLLFSSYLFSSPLSLLSISHFVSFNFPLFFSLILPLSPSISFCLSVSFILPFI